MDRKPERLLVAKKIEKNQKIAFKIAIKEKNRKLRGIFIPHLLIYTVTIKED